LSLLAGHYGHAGGCGCPLLAAFALNGKWPANGSGRPTAGGSAVMTMTVTMAVGLRAALHA